MRQTFLGLRSIAIAGVVAGLCGMVALRAGNAPDPDRVKESLLALRLAEAGSGPSPDPEVTRRLREAYRELAESHPDHAAARNAYAAFLFDHGSPAEAVDLWHETLKREPDNAEAAFQIGHANLRAGNAAAALDYLQRAAASPSVTAFQVYSYANALYLFRREARDSTPEDALEQALAQFGRATRLEPGNLEYARGYAETFFALPNPNWPEALLAWKRVVDLTPESNPSLSFHLLQAARAALAAERPEDAAALLDRLPPGTAGSAEKKLRARIAAARAPEAPR